MPGRTRLVLHIHAYIDRLREREREIHAMQIVRSPRLIASARCPYARDVYVKSTPLLPMDARRAVAGARYMRPWECNRERHGRVTDCTDIYPGPFYGTMA